VIFCDFAKAKLKNVIALSNAKYTKWVKSALLKLATLIQTMRLILGFAMKLMVNQIEIHPFLQQKKC
jgi:hypothetical protein